MGKWVSLKTSGYFIENEIYDISEPYFEQTVSLMVVDVYHNGNNIGIFGSLILGTGSFITLSEFRQNRINQILDENI